jgi:heme/copper-type cytochrome/quinol oxidase subunit 2
MKKIKRILALLVVILLLSLYALTFFASLTASPNQNALFMASLYCTVVVPIMIFAYTLVYRIVKRRAKEDYYNNKPNE